MPGLEAVFAEIEKLRFGGAVVFCVKVSVFVKNFRMGKFNAVACMGI